LSRAIKLKGLPVLIELQHTKIPFTNSAIAVSGNFLREYPEVVESVLKGFLDAQAYIAAPANRRAVIQTMMRHMKLSDPTVLEDGYQDLLIGLEKKPYAVVEGLRNIQRMLATLNPKAIRPKVEDVIDNRIIRKLDESGYIDGLYAKR
jgi:ABC-type nitrate/sulfonate/bicarbonate transport system substrate-binding protein